MPLSWRMLALFCAWPLHVRSRHCTHRPVQLLLYTSKHTCPLLAEAGGGTGSQTSLYSACRVCGVVSTTQGDSWASPAQSQVLSPFSLARLGMDLGQQVRAGAVTPCWVRDGEPGGNAHLGHSPEARLTPCGGIWTGLRGTVSPAARARGRSA